jgi:hypothetical protein
MPTKSEEPRFFRLPVVAHGAEFLVQGYLMRRNILTYKAPPNNEGYDLICIHPNPRTVTKQIRVQVKSRFATNSGLAFPVHAKSFDAFDFLIAAFLNIGYYGGTRATIDGRCEPEFYTLPVSFIKKHHRPSDAWPSVRLRHIEPKDLEKYKGDSGFEQIAKALKIPYPAKAPREDR